MVSLEWVHHVVTSRVKSLFDHVSASQSEKRWGIQEMPVIGVDFGEAMIGGTGEMKGVGGAYACVRWN